MMDVAISIPTSDLSPWEFAIRFDEIKAIQDIVEQDLHLGAKKYSLGAK